MTETLALLTQEERVENGVAFLAKIPNWRSRIDPESFNITRATHCVLGQLYGRGAFGAPSRPPYDWDAVCEAAQIDQQTAWACGFTLNMPEAPAINLLWLKVLAEQEVEIQVRVGELVGV